MKGILKLADKDDFFIIKNFIPLFRHYIASVYDELPNEYGVFSYDESKTLQEMCDQREKWVKDPKNLFPFIIYAFDRPVGYLLISIVQPDSEQECDYFFNALFIVKSVRRKGIASMAVKEIFDRFKGTWELHTSLKESNVPTRHFWRKVISEYTQGNFEEITGITSDDVEKIIFKFTSELGDVNKVK